jgi:RimJ/RimL family protein N-acetyltransferase
MEDVVRRVDVEDWRPYRELRLEALKESPFAFVERYEDALGRPDEFWRERMARSAAEDGVTTFVVVRDGRFVAQATCLIERDAVAHVVGVYVTPPARGGRVAESLMAAVLRWARERRGARRVRLFVTGANPRAAAFYRRIGFVATGLTVPYPPDPDVLEHELELRQATVKVAIIAMSSCSRLWQCSRYRPG